MKAHTRAYKAAYIRAYHHLKAARQVELDAVAAVRKTFDREKADRRTAGILSRELRRRGGEAGKTTRRFLGSITHKGTSGGLTVWTPCAPRSMSWRTAGSWQGDACPAASGGGG